MVHQVFTLSSQVEWLHGSLFFLVVQRAYLRLVQSSRDHTSSEIVLQGFFFDIAIASELSTNQGGPGSLRFGYGSHMERFEWFRFRFRRSSEERVLLCISVQFKGMARVPVSVPEKRFCRFLFVSSVPLSGSGSVPAPS